MIFGVLPQKKNQYALRILGKALSQQMVDF